METTQKIVYTRQEDGKYIPSGELPAGTKYVTLQIAGRAGMNTPRTVNEAVKIIENAIQSGHAKAETYTLIPIETPASEKPAKAAKAPKAAKPAITAPVVDPNSSPAIISDLETQIAQIQETRGCTRKEATKLAKKAIAAANKKAKAEAKKQAKADKKAAKKAKAAKPAKAAKAPKATPAVDPNSSPAIVRRARHTGDDSDLPALYEAAKAAMRDPNRPACKNGHPITFENANPADLRRLGKYYCLPCIKGYAKGEYKK